MVNDGVRVLELQMVTNEKVFGFTRKAKLLAACA